MSSPRHADGSFNKAGPEYLLRTDDKAQTQTLGEYLAENSYSDAFRDHYLIPMTASIWSTPPTEMLKFPMLTLLRFFHNHGLMQIFDRPQWLTVTNGSREYIKRALTKVSEVRLNTPVVAVRRTAVGKVVVRDHTQREESFDHVIFACHGDQALRLLADRTPQEHSILKNIQYKHNRAVVHRDVSVRHFAVPCQPPFAPPVSAARSRAVADAPGGDGAPAPNPSQLMPKRRATWSSWNYITRSTGNGPSDVCLTYWMNNLQPFMPQGPEHDLFVTLNPLTEPRKETVLAEMEYEHPVYTINVGHPALEGGGRSRGLFID